MNPISSIYSRSASDGVWQRLDHGEFGYSDGDEVENRIASVIAATQDCSVLSSQLRSHIIDWPTRYHLSSQRANILRPLRSSLSGSVLEIGSGCGAITRYLGEVARSVTALEGSRRRAHITRLRTRDQNNVEVICDEFSAFQTDQRFDAVTLVGVLEYANMFVRSDQAALHMLSKARARLNDDGCLIIAIENQLGLKYWAGALEDHLGQAMLGLEDKYKPGGVRTYGKKALGDLLKSAGFESVDFLYPFPDYKLPSCVLTEEAFNDPAFDPTPFLVMTAGKDHQLPSDLAFCLERVWPVVQTNGLAADLSNSFLIVAKPRGNSTAAAPEGNNQALAWHFSTQRLPQFCKETTFSREWNRSGISIARRPLSNLEESLGKSVRGLSHRLTDDTPYSPQPLLSSILIDFITRPGWTDRQLADFVLLYASQLSKIGKIELVQNECVRWEQPLPGWMLDCIPQNIIVHPDGTCNAFDLEWRLEHEISFVQLVFRSLWHTVGGLSQIGTHANEPRLSTLDIINRTLRLLGTDLSTAQAESLVLLELELQLTLSGDRLNFEQTWDWLKNGIKRQHNSHWRLTECLGQINAMAELQQHSRNLEQEINNRDMALVDLRRDRDHLAEEVKNKDASLLQAQQATQSILDHFRVDSRRSNQAIRRLTRQLTNNYLVSRSAKSLVKLARDFEHVIQQSALASPRQSSYFPSRWIGVINGWKQSKPMLVGFACIEQIPQAEQLMAQSCHWSFPFQWQFDCIQPSVSEAIPTLASQLEIDAKTSIHPKSTIINQSVWRQDLPTNSLLALPRLIGPTGANLSGNWPLPDAELLRLAYIAFLCNHKLSVAYVGAREILDSPDRKFSDHPVMTIFRGNLSWNLLQEASFWSKEAHLGQIQKELAQLQQMTTNKQQHILVI